LKIGIDLDNTLIDYSKAFLFGGKQMGLVPITWQGSRQEIRKVIRSLPEGEHSWQSLQGRVYGRWINKASLFSGSYRFLWRCRLRGWQPIVVSHKTEYGHYDSDHIPLREVALEFLKSENVWETEPNKLLNAIFFETNRDSKIKTIEKLELDIFVDDTPEVLNDLNFPNSTRALLFDPENQHSLHGLESFTSWDQLGSTLLGEWSSDEYLVLLHECGFTNVKTVFSLKSGGNARTNRFETHNKNFVLKIYPSDCVHDRLKSEYDGLNILFRNGITEVPKPISCDKKLLVAVYDWVDGFSVNDPQKTDIQNCADFIIKLQNLRNKKEFEKFPKASAACLSGKDIVSQIKSRQDKLLVIGHEQLCEYLDREFRPLFERILRRAQGLWPEKEFSTELNREDQILSPSDFGFHNALKKPDGNLVFLDFEYFGWDDPVKLLSDFSFHPGMNLSREAQSWWFDYILRNVGMNLKMRLQAAWPLYGLCWSLILLNEFREEVWERRLGANTKIKKKSYSIQARQLERSRKNLKWINDCITSEKFVYN